MKGRPPTHPLIVHIGGAHQLDDWAAEVPEPARRIAERFWPGPLTLVLRRSRRVPDAVTGGLETVALRVPAHPAALDVLTAFGGGVAAPSANRFGQCEPHDGRPRGGGTGRRRRLRAGRRPLRGRCRVHHPGPHGRAGDPASRRRGTRGTREGPGVPVRVGAKAAVRVPGQHPRTTPRGPGSRLVEPDRVVDEAERLREKGHRPGVLLPSAYASRSASPAGQVVVEVPHADEEYARRLYEFCATSTGAGAMSSWRRCRSPAGSAWPSRTGCGGRPDRAMRHRGSPEPLGPPDRRGRRRAGHGEAGAATP